jgi:hypothetical protein
VKWSSTSANFPGVLFSFRTILIVILSSSALCAIRLCRQPWRAYKKRARGKLDRFASYPAQDVLKGDLRMIDLWDGDSSTGDSRSELRLTTLPRYPQKQPQRIVGRRSASGTDRSSQFPAGLPARDRRRRRRHPRHPTSGSARAGWADLCAQSKTVDQHGGHFNNETVGRKGTRFSLGGAGVPCTRTLAVSVRVHLKGYTLQEVNKVDFGAEKRAFVRASEV